MKGFVGKLSNKKRKILLWAFIFFCVGSRCIGYGQDRSELEKRKKETLDEIKLTNILIKKTEENRKESVNKLVLINRKIKSRNNLISNIQDELDLLENQITENKELLFMLNEDLGKLKDEYAEMIYFAYKNRRGYDRMNFIFASKDFNQAYKRIKYLQQYGEFRRKQALVIKRMEDLVGTKNDKLLEYQEERKNLLGENEREKERIGVERIEQNKLLINLQKREGELKLQLTEKERIARELEKAIEAIIAEEAKRGRNFNSLTPEERIIADNFKSNKGRLPWPTERGIITGSFGIQEHPVLKGVKIENFGIYITTTENAEARVVFEGEVKKVIGIPGANQAVIVQHGNYFSVYQNLINVRVKTGDRVNIKQTLGNIYTDLNEENKTTLNFMIWEEKRRLNPAEWLSEN